MAVDLVAMDSIENVTIYQGDIRERKILNLLSSLGGQAGEKKVFDVLLSDMAHSFTGFRSADVARVESLVRFSLEVAGMDQILKPGGNYVAKYLNGEGDDELKEFVSSKFLKFATFKPKSCRDSSSESYLIGIGFKNITL